MTPPDPSRRSDEIEAEIEAHLAHRVDDLLAAGLTETEARVRAREEFGDPERIKAESRRVRERARRRSARASRLDVARQDLGFAVRQIVRDPGFALTALVTLTVGVGATVTLASVVGSVVLAPLPFTEPNRVVLPEMLTPDGQRFSVSEAAFVTWRDEARSFESMAASQVVAGTLRSPGEPRSVAVGRITHDYLKVLGRSPVLGRGFRPEEDLPGAAAPVALVSHAMWRSELSADPGALGRRLDVDGRSLEIVGVLPADLTVLTGDTPIFVPLGPDPTLDPGDHYLDVVARLAPGTSLEAADVELDAVQRTFSERRSVDAGWSTHVLEARSLLVGDTVERGGWVLMAAAALLLVMACVNVSNLLMARATARHTEMALRTALGASRGRLVRQLFTESALLAGGGGVLGGAVAALALPVVRAVGAGRIPRLESATLDARAFVAGLVAVTLAALACGLAPVVQLRAERLRAALVAGRRGGTDATGRVRSLLVAAQVSLSVVLLVGTGLLLRSFLALSSVDPGFEARGTLAFSIDMPDASYPWQARAELVPRLRESLGSLPGVVAVGASAVEPFSGLALANFVAPEDRVPDRAEDFTPVHWRVVTPGFFEAMGMELLEGRDFTEADDWENGTPVVIGRSLARALWGSRSAVGRRLVWSDPEGSHQTVVGVVEDLRDVNLDEDPMPIVYRPHRQISWSTMTMVVRYEGDPAAVAGSLRARVPEIVPGLPVGEIASLRENLRRAVAQPRFNLQLLSGFAGVGLLLALVGVYGLTAFDIRRRFPEIGIRLSLGADPADVRRLIVAQRMRLTVLGVGAGLGLAWWVSGAMSALLYGVGRGDATTWACAALLVVGASVLATWIPSRRALNVDPREVLNAD